MATTVSIQPQAIPLDSYARWARVRIPAGGVVRHVGFLGVHRAPTLWVQTDPRLDGVQTVALRVVGDGDWLDVPPSASYAGTLTWPGEPSPAVHVFLDRVPGPEVPAA